MATKAEYLTALASKAVYVGSPVEDQAVANDPSLGGIKCYDVGMLLSIPNGAYMGTKQKFYVIDEGGPGETVYPSTSQRANVSQWRSDFEAFVNGKLNGVNIRITRDVVNEDIAGQEFAIVTAHQFDSQADTITPKRFFVAKIGGTFQFKEFVG